MEDAAYDELKKLRSENKRLKRILQPFVTVSKVITDFSESTEDFNSSYFTEILNREYNFTLDGPLLEDYVKLYQEFTNT
jgi:hypothetical protein